MRGIVAVVFVIVNTCCLYAQSLYPVRDTISGLYGYKNASTFKWGILPKFEEAEPFFENAALVSQKGLWGLIDKKGQYIIQPVYDRLEGERFLTFEKDSTKGILTTKGKMLLSGNFSHLYYEPSLGNALLTQNNLYGYWDTLGHYIAPLSKYELSFENELAYFNSNASKGFIKKDGTKVIEISQGELWDISPFGYISRSNNYECAYDSRGKQIGECNLNKVIQMNKEVVVFVKDSSYGIMNYKGELISYKEYDFVGPFNERGLSIVSKSGKYGMINQEGKLFLPLEYQFIEDFGKEFNRLFGKPKNYFHYTVFKNNDQYGVMNDSGRIVVKPQYKMAMMEGDALLACLMHDTVSVIDLTKNKKAPLSKYFKFIHGRARICFPHEGKCGIINKQGRVVIPLNYTSLSPVGSNGYAIVKDSTGAGIVDSIGHQVVPLTYADVKTLDDVFNQYYKNHGDYAWDGFLYLVTKSGRVGIAKESGLLVVDTTYYNAAVYDDDGLCWFVKDKNVWRIINYEGKKLPGSFSSSSVFSQGVAIVQKGKKFGLISTTGKIILPFKYQMISEEPFGVYFVQKKSLWGMANRNGKIITPPQFTSKTSFNAQFAFAKNSQWGILNYQGKFTSGFEDLKNDTLNLKIINGSKIVSYSYTNIPEYSEVSFDLLQTHDSVEFARQANTLILNCMEKMFMNAGDASKAIFVNPEKSDTLLQDIQYSGRGVEIVNVSGRTISIVHFEEQFDEEKNINSSVERAEVYLREHKQFKKARLADIFSSDLYIKALNQLLKEEAIKSKWILSDDVNDSTLFFKEDEFLLLNDELVLKYNPSAFHKEQELKTDFTIPYESIKSLIKEGSVVNDFYK